MDLEVKGIEGRVRAVAQGHAGKPRQDLAGLLRVGGRARDLLAVFSHHA